MKDVFTAVRAYLGEKIPGAQQITRWNNQLENDGTEKVLTFPAIYYQLDGLKMTTISRGVQQAEGILRLRHCSRGLVNNQHTGVDFEAATYLALQAWKGGPITTGLDRIAIYPDPNYGAVEVIISEYHIRYTDSSKLHSQVRLEPGSRLTGEAEFILQ